MPGWLSERSAPLSDEIDGAPIHDDADEPSSAAQDVSVTQTDKHSRAPSSMSQHQRDVLIAEVLGDVLVLSKKVTVLSTQIAAIAQAVTAILWRRAMRATGSGIVQPKPARR